MRKLCHFVMFSAAVLLLSACRKDSVILPPEESQVEEGDENAVVSGFYLLNEGVMGSNKASLDFYDFTTGVYSNNIFPSRNPNVTKELGDVGNDLKIYGSRLYAVINCSNLVEVMTADSAIHIGIVNIPNCRDIEFYNGKAYVSSFAGPVQLGDYQLGYVAEIDTATLQITRTCTVGYQPEEMVVLDGSKTKDGKPKLYVANSGGYIPPDYDNTVSVIDIESFTEEEKIPVYKNLHRMAADAYGDIYVTSRGDYYELQSKLFCLDPRTGTVKKTFDIAASNICLQGDSLYLTATEYNYNTGEQPVSYAIINVASEEIVSQELIKDGTKINFPYTIAVHPVTREFIITDAGVYTSPGMLYYFNADGTLKWSHETGDVPGHIEWFFD